MVVPEPSAEKRKKEKKEKKDKKKKKQKRHRKSESSGDDDVTVDNNVPSKRRVVAKKKKISQVRCIKLRPVFKRLSSTLECALKERLWYILKSTDSLIASFV